MPGEAGTVRSERWDRTLPKRTVQSKTRADPHGTGVIPRFTRILENSLMPDIGQRIR